MAKLKAPLLSLGATQQIGKALVFFGWKGLDVVREYVIPANPNTIPQQTQRGRLSDAVAAVHAAMANATKPLIEADKTAYALWASVVQSATTWFNQAVRNFIDQMVAGLTGAIFRGGYATPGANQLVVGVYSDRILVGHITTGVFKYGTSKTALVGSQAATVAPGTLTAYATIAGLTTGQKYYVQFEATGVAAYVGVKSGIYYGVPT